MEDKAMVHVFVSGRVHGVFFRAGTAKKAKELGLAGWVRNLPDGRVEAVFEGGKEAIGKIIEWAKRGPFLAKVEKLDVSEGEYKGGFDSFEIKY